jgi:NADH:ubiquinone oxidoreductase subunit K
MLQIQQCLIFNAILFAIGIGGMVLNRKNLLIFLMCIEIVFYFIPH